MSKNKKIYILGALLGILAIVSALATTHILGRTNFLGATTTIVRAAGFIERLFSPESVAYSTYYANIGIRVDWQFMLVIGIGIGSFITAIATGTFKIEFVPPVWKERFGSSGKKRAIFAFLGGILTIFGARLAGGCPSGHGISGLMQLSVSSFVAMFFFFECWCCFLVYRVIANAKVTGGFTLGHLVDEKGAADFSPKFHVF